MDSFSTQKNKSRKIKKSVRKSRVQIIIDLFSRTIEIIVVLVTIAKLCHQLVIAFEDSGVAAVILANRNLAFVVGNAIVIALIAKSGLFSNQELDKKRKNNDVYEEFVLERSRRDGISRVDMRNRGNQSETGTRSMNETGEKQSEAEKETQSITENIVKLSISDEIAKQSLTEKKTKQSISDQTEKQSVTEKKTKQRIYKKREKHNKRENFTKQSIVEHEEMIEKENLIEKKQSPSYQRSQSENLEGSGKSSYGRLRRSETDASSERFDTEDELRYKIESFIARQRRNQIDD